VEADTKSKRLTPRLDQLEADQDSCLRIQKGEQEPVAEVLDGPAASAADDRPDDALVLGEQSAGRLVAFLRGERGEALEVDEGNRQRSGTVSRASSSASDDRIWIVDRPKRRECGGPLLDGSLEPALK
jgi:hypothetical protein